MTIKKRFVATPVDAKENFDFQSIGIKSSKIAFKLVIIPIFLLFFGLFADKTLSTTPLFIVVGFIAGLFFALYKAKKISGDVK
jgi:F0F1-type ATP synthase assembly protein I